MESIKCNDVYDLLDLCYISEDQYFKTILIATPSIPLGTSSFSQVQYQVPKVKASTTSVMPVKKNVIHSLPTRFNANKAPTCIGTIKFSLQDALMQFTQFVIKVSVSQVPPS